MHIQRKPQPIRAHNNDVIKDEQSWIQDPAIFLPGHGPGAGSGDKALRHSFKNYKQ